VFPSAVLKPPHNPAARQPIEPRFVFICEYIYSSYLGVIFSNFSSNPDPSPLQKNRAYNLVGVIDLHQQNTTHSTATQVAVALNPIVKGKARYGLGN